MTDFDETKVTNQPALTTSTGRSWLVMGGLFTAIVLALLIAMTTLPPPGVAFVAAFVVAALYLGMIVVRLTVAPGRRRLAFLSAGMLAIAAVSLVAALIIGFVTLGTA
jgi:hypothetical protein